MLHILSIAKKNFYYVLFYYCIYEPPYRLLCVFSLFLKKNRGIIFLTWHFHAISLQNTATFFKIMNRIYMFSTFFSCYFNILLQWLELIYVIKIHVRRAAGRGYSQYHLYMCVYVRICLFICHASWPLTNNDTDLKFGRHTPNDLI